MVGLLWGLTRRPSHVGAGERTQGDRGVDAAPSDPATGQRPERCYEKSAGRGYDHHAKPVQTRLSTRLRSPPDPRKSGVKLQTYPVIDDFYSDRVAIVKTM